MSGLTRRLAHGLKAIHHQNKEKNIYHRRSHLTDQFNREARGPPQSPGAFEELHQDVWSFDAATQAKDNSS